MEWECPIKGIDVAHFLEAAIQEHGQPEMIKVDNGPEFISRELDLWAYGKKIKLDFSRQGARSLALRRAI